MYEKVTVLERDHIPAVVSNKPCTGRLPTGSLQDQGSGNPVRCTGPQALQRASTSGALDLRSDTQPHNRYTGPRNRQADLYTSGKTYTFDRYCHAVTGAAFGSGISNALYPIYRTGAGCRSGFRTPGPVDWSWGAALCEVCGAGCTMGWPKSHSYAPGPHHKLLYTTATKTI